MAINSNTSDGGTTLPESQQYQYGETATVTAQTNNDFEFDGWYENGIRVSTEEEYSFTATKNSDLVGKFKSYDLHSKCTIDVRTSNENFGTVAITDPQATYDIGSSCIMTATPTDGYVFVHWEQYINDAWMVLSSALQYTYTFKSDDSQVIIRGVFVAEVDDEDLSITMSLSENNMEGLQLGNQFNVVLTTHRQEQEIVYKLQDHDFEDEALHGQLDDDITLQVDFTNASDAYRYKVHWTINSDIEQSGDSLQFTLKDNMNISLSFEDTMYLVVITPDPTEGISQQIDPQTGTNTYTRYVGYYKDGRYCTISPYPASCYSFDHWDLGNSQISTDYNYTVINNSNQTVRITAVYTQNVSVDVDVKELDGIKYGTATGDVRQSPNRKFYAHLVATPGTFNGKTVSFDRWIDVDGNAIGYLQTLDRFISNSQTFYACFIVTDNATGETQAYPAVLQEDLQNEEQYPYISNTYTKFLTSYNQFVTLQEDDIRDDTNTKHIVVKVKLPDSVTYTTAGFKGMLGIIISVYHNGTLEDAGVQLADLVENTPYGPANKDIKVHTGRYITQSDLYLMQTEHEFVINSVKANSVYFLRPFIANNISIIYGKEIVVFTNINPNSQDRISWYGLLGLFKTQPDEHIYNGHKFNGALHLSENTESNINEILSHNRRYGVLSKNKVMNQNTIESANEYVVFSTGNLRCSGINEELRFDFYDDQYEISQSSGTRRSNQFAWGTSGFVLQTTKKPFDYYLLTPGGERGWSGNIIWQNGDSTQGDNEVTVIDLNDASQHDPDSRYMHVIHSDKPIWLWQDAQDSLANHFDTNGDQYLGLFDMSSHELPAVAALGKVVKLGSGKFNPDIYDRYRMMHLYTCPYSSVTGVTQNDIADALGCYLLLPEKLGVYSADIAFKYMDKDTGYGPSAQINMMNQRSTQVDRDNVDRDLLENQYPDGAPAWTNKTGALSYNDFMYANSKIEGCHGLWGGYYPYHRLYKAPFASKNFDWGVHNAEDFDNEKWRTLHNDFFMCTATNFEPEYTYIKKAHPMCQCRIVFDDNTTAEGYIMLPDNWRDSYWQKSYAEVEAEELLPDGWTQSSTVSIQDVNYANANNITIELPIGLFEKLASYGMVFIRKAGFSVGNYSSMGTIGIDQVAAYWTADWCTSDYRTTAADFMLGNRANEMFTWENDGQIYNQYINKRYVRKSVRPVLDVADYIELSNDGISLLPQPDKKHIFFNVDCDGLTQEQLGEVTSISDLDALLRSYNVFISPKNINIQWDSRYEMLHGISNGIDISIHYRNSEHNTIYCECYNPVTNKQIPEISMTQEEGTYVYTYPSNQNMTIALSIYHE